MRYALTALVEEEGWEVEERHDQAEKRWEEIDEGVERCMSKTTGEAELELGGEGRTEEESSSAWLYGEAITLSGWQRAKN